MYTHTHIYHYINSEILKKKTMLTKTKKKSSKHIEKYKTTFLK